MTKYSNTMVTPWQCSVVSLCLLLFLIHLHHSYAEDDYSPKPLSSDCKTYDFHKKPTLITRDNKYGLWPGLMSPKDLESGETLFGMDEAMEIIWQNQNPPDCKKAKYLILEGWHQGYGSELHIYGVGLAIALDMGYVLLQKGGWSWRYNNQFCDEQGKKSLDCYYAPLSKCTIHDAIRVIYPNGPEKFRKKKEQSNDQWTKADDDKLLSLVRQYGNKGNWSKISESYPTKTSVQCAMRWRNILRKRLDTAPQGSELNKLIHSDVRTMADFIANHEGIYPLNRVLFAKVEDEKIVLLPNHTDRLSPNVMVLGEEVYFKAQKFVPTVFLPMLRCTDMDKDAYYLWWRAISATFLIRPNNATLNLLEKTRDQHLVNINGNCISTYVRHGDKGIEMQLVPFQNYASMAMKLWKKTDVPGLDTSKPKVFYIASDDYQAINQAHQWGKKHNIMVRQSNMSRTILSDRRQIIKQHDMERNFPPSRAMEYFSYILHLADTVYCEATICTWPSNYCRLIDELRTTVGGKANRVFVDLSVETCEKGPPCIRDHGLGNYKGKYYDPKDRLW